MSRLVYIVWKDLGEVYEGDPFTLKAVCSTRKRANKVKTDLIQEEVARPHWHKDYTEEQKIEISSRYYVIEEVNLL